MNEVSVILKLLHNSNKNVLQINAMPVVEASLTLSFLYQYQYVSSSKSEIIDSASPDIRFDFLFSRKCSPLSHIHVLLNAECIFTAKSFSFGNLFMLIIFWKLSTL